MLVIQTNKSGRWRSIDLHSLPIGKTFAHKLMRADLYREAKLLGVPGIEQSMGWQQIALAYGTFLAEQRERAESGDAA